MTRPMPPEMATDEMLRRLKDWMGDSRNAQLKLASRRGRRLRPVRPIGIMEREGIPEPRARGDGLLDSRLVHFTVKDEMAKRAKVLSKAMRGDPVALAFVRDGFRVTNWVHHKRKLIVDSVLVGARR